jgi:choline dehydrogenase-like flavoprotein
MKADVIFDTEWDVIIIGAGMGGGSAAYQLTQHQKNILLIEKGHSSFKKFNGVEVEEKEAEVRLDSGHWPTQLTATVNGAKSDFWAPLGCGVGGSSLLYAAALQRLLKADFDEQTLPSGGTVQWPFNYEELASYYQLAETQFSVCGTIDPLEPTPNYTLTPPPAMSLVDQHFFQQFKAAGFNPYRLHVAIKYRPLCGECGGHICPKSCKQDSNNACIEPAKASGYLTVLGDTEVIRIDADKTSVTSIQVKYLGKEKTLRAKQYILAAGAYFTPIILKRSTSVEWPNGLANGSGLVGKNLMFHASDFIAFWPKEKYSRKGYRKTIAFRDLYNVTSPKWGELQSTGVVADYGLILYGLRLEFDQSIFKKIPFIRYFLTIPAFIASKLFGHATVFTTIIEDFPYTENQVVIDESAPSGMRIEYTIHKEFNQRVSAMGKSVRKRLSNLRSYSLSPSLNLNYGHPCGTCKAGDDPASSVVDKFCKAHEVDNLYIANSSFMPTSGGTNPSLTVAANAFRVADHVAEKLNNLLPEL